MAHIERHIMTTFSTFTTHLSTYIISTHTTRMMRSWLMEHGPALSDDEKAKADRSAIIALAKARGLEWAEAIKNGKYSGLTIPGDSTECKTARKAIHDARKCFVLQGERAAKGDNSAAFEALMARLGSANDDVQSKARSEVKALWVAMKR